MKIGTRVVAISHTEGNTFFIFGRGIYAGDFPMNSEAKGDVAAMVPAWMLNPRIDLDNGKRVWGCECWWKDEANFDKKYAGCEIVEIDIDVERAKVR